MKKYSKTSKSKNIKRHFQKRCVERLGFPISSKDLVKQIQSNKLDFVRKMSNTRSMFLYQCPIDNTNYNVVYDKLRHDVVTIYRSRKQKRLEVKV